MKKYNFYYISTKTTLKEEDKEQINENIQNSNVIMIDQNRHLNLITNENHLIIGFENTLIILKQSCISFISILLSKNTKLSVCYLSDTKNVVNQLIGDEINNQEIEADSTFTQEISNFKNEFNLNKKANTFIKIWSYISQCISGYLIKKSYLSQSQYRFEELIQYFDKYANPEVISEQEYIELRSIGRGSVFICYLIYHIKRGDLYVIKKPKCSDLEIHKLIERETSNYLNISHLYLPRFYGTVKDKKYIVIEFIKGQTLDNINKIQLTFNEKLNIIFEILTIINHFHDYNLIYRDLKPNNVIIDENKRAILIDFDRLISIDSDAEYENHTLDISSEFCDPEVNNSQRFTFKSDIYSIGKIIEYLFNDAEYNNEYLKIGDIVSKCININPKERPSISELIQIFCSLFPDQYQIDFTIKRYNEHLKNFNLFCSIIKITPVNSHVLYLIGIFFLLGNYIPQNIDKAIHYISSAAKQNHTKAQHDLGIIYYDGIYVARDINKAIYYLSCAANQNYADAQFMLGTIYYGGKYIKLNMNKAIQYLSLAAKQNYAEAQHNLGCIYYDGKHVARDINKAIYYMSCAADQNYSESQYFLGCFYYNGKYITRDINKSIQYYSLAAKQNHAEAQCALGCFYYDGKYITPDINKSIQYFSLAANQNYAEAQYNLGCIYFNRKFITRDVNKFIQYFSLAANQNHAKAQNILGIIYYEGIYITRDINKSIQYLSLAAKQNHAEAQYSLGCIYCNKVIRLEKKYSFYLCHVIILYVLNQIFK